MTLEMRDDDGITELCFHISGTYDASGTLYCNDCGQKMRMVPYTPAVESPTFAYSLAMYLTRNNQQHTFTSEELQSGIEQFMRERR